MGRAKAILLYVEIEADDVLRILEKRMAIHEDTQTIRLLLEEDENDDEADEDDDSDS